MSVGAEIAGQEKRDATFAAEMHAARQELAQEYQQVMPVSLATLRLRAGLSQAKLAQTINTSQSHIAKIEAGSVQIYLETAARLAKVLNVSVEDIARVLATNIDNKPSGKA